MATTSDSWPKLFTWVDYLLFAVTLLVSSLVGIYHAWRGASDSTSEYLMGGRKMPIFPVAMSLAARYYLQHFHLFQLSSFHRTRTSATLLGEQSTIYESL